MDDPVLKNLVDTLRQLRDTGGTLSGFLISTVQGRPAITCFTCFRTSVNPRDIEQQYCGHCHIFHGDPYA